MVPGAVLSMPSEGACWLMGATSHMERGLWPTVNNTGCLEVNLQRVQDMGELLDWVVLPKRHLTCQGLTPGPCPW